jgi:hypothetical protein
MLSSLLCIGGLLAFISFPFLLVEGIGRIIEANKTLMQKRQDLEHRLIDSRYSVTKNETEIAELEEKIAAMQ